MLCLNLDDHRSRWEWPHEYTYFLLHKENIDTMQAVSGLAPLLGGARASMLSYAGTKDKRAKTTQWVRIKKLNYVQNIDTKKCMKFDQFGKEQYRSTIVIHLSKIFSFRYVLKNANHL